MKKEVFQARMKAAWDRVNSALVDLALQKGIDIKDPTYYGKGEELEMLTNIEFLADTLEQLAGIGDQEAR